jgi:hypothetical protein
VIDFDELVGWLSAQLDEDERTARAAAEGRGEWRLDDNDDWVRALNVGVALTIAPGFLDPVQWEHIARHDPVRALREVAAKRRIIGNCEAVINGTGWPGLAQIVLRLLAMPHSHREGYHDDWKMP